jgi:hypothetical protein
LGTLKEDLVEYDPQGGAYLFLPTGKAQSVSLKYAPKVIRHVQGRLVRELTTVRSVVTRTIRLYSSSYSNNFSS